MAHKVETHIAHLDQALTLIAELGVLFKNMALKEQKALLKEIVDRVVIDPNGTVIRIELQSPFSYLRNLTEGIEAGATQRSGAEKTKTSKRSAAGSCSNDVSSGGPEGLRLVS